MKTKLRYLIVCVGLLPSLSCEDSSSVTSAPPLQPQIVNPFRFIMNVPWTLTQAVFGDTTLNLRVHRPFRILVGDTMLYGDDGCNQYWGKYDLDTSCLTVSYVFSTGILCPGSAALNPCQMIAPWRIDLRDTSLVFSTTGICLTFSSSFTKPIDATRLAKRWRLHASNDTAFDSLKAANLLPILHLTEDRKFLLEWYFSPRNPLFSSNSVGGAFGIGQGGSICFYRTGSQYCPSPVPLTDRMFVRRITEATTFDFSDSSFTLVRIQDGKYYRFVHDLARLSGHGVRDQSHDKN